MHRLNESKAVLWNSWSTSLPYSTSRLDMARWLACFSKVEVGHHGYIFFFQLQTCISQSQTFTYWTTATITTTTIYNVLVGSGWWFHPLNWTKQTTTQGDLRAFWSTCHRWKVAPYRSYLQEDPQAPTCKQTFEKNIGMVDWYCTNSNI